MLGTHGGRIPAAMPFFQHVGIAINDNHRIVHYHTQYEYQCCQCDGVEFDTRDIHQSYANGYADWHARACHQCRAQREEQQHDCYHHDDGDENIF